MRNFEFRLRAVLEQRERQEELAKQGFFSAEAAARRAEKLLEEMKDVRTAIVEEQRQQLVPSQFDPLEARFYQDYLRIITQSIRGQEEFVREALLLCEAQKLNLIGAAQEHKMITQMRDKALTLHQTRAQRTEQKTMDELATLRHNYRERTLD